MQTAAVRRLAFFCCFESGAPQIAPDKNKSINFEW
jgi:hypothetical protein